MPMYTGAKSLGKTDDLLKTQIIFFQEWTLTEGESVLETIAFDNLYTQAESYMRC